MNGSSRAPQAVPDAVLAALRQLDGTSRSSVSMLSGLTQAELDDLGGIGGDA